MLHIFLIAWEGSHEPHSLFLNLIIKVKTKWDLYLYSFDFMKQDSRGAASNKNREIYDKEEMEVLSQLSESEKLMFFCD